MSGKRGQNELLEPRHELLALTEQLPFVDEPRPHTLLDALDEHAVFRPDLAVELQELVYPLRLRIAGEEVVEVASRAVRPVGQDRADREVRPAGEDVDLDVRPDEVELALTLIPVPCVRELGED